MTTALSRNLFLGFVKLRILYHANREPIHGLWLIGELARHGYRLSPGTLYPMLHGLERDGLLAAEKQVVEGRARKCYTLTRQGKAALAEGRMKARELLDEIEGDSG